MMSKLVTCPDCGKQISKQAKACPNCGSPQKSGVGSMGRIISWFIGRVLSLVAAVVFLPLRAIARGLGAVGMTVVFGVTVAVVLGMLVLLLIK